MFCHHGDAYTKYHRQQPERSGLESHPWGHRWISDAHYALNLLANVKRLYPYHYLPLFARHCSDGDVTGELVVYGW